MYRAIPKPNKILDEKWNQKQLELHKKRVKDMRATVTTRFQSKNLKHITNNGKKQKMFEGMYLIIFISMLGN